MNTLIIDNHDSFVHNVARYCRELGHSVHVARPDAITLNDIRSERPDAIILSPGPCSPSEAVLSMAVIGAFAGQIPIFGVCLGHQCIGAAFGGKVVRAQVPMHGRTSLINHKGSGLFAGLPRSLKVGRYHSLVVQDLPDHTLRVEATSAEGEIMALSHRDLPVWGVQFHPESVLSDHGHAIFAAFFDLAHQFNNTQTPETADVTAA